MPGARPLERLVSFCQGECSAWLVSSPRGSLSSFGVTVQIEDTLVVAYRTELWCWISLLDRCGLRWLGKSTFTVSDASTFSADCNLLEGRNFGDTLLHDVKVCTTRVVPRLFTSSPIRLPGCQRSFQRKIGGGRSACTIRTSIRDGCSLGSRGSSSGTSPLGVPRMPLKKDRTCSVFTRPSFDSSAHHTTSRCPRRYCLAYCL